VNGSSGGVVTASRKLSVGARPITVPRRRGGSVALLGVASALLCVGVWAVLRAGVEAAAWWEPSGGAALLPDALSLAAFGILLGAPAAFAFALALDLRRSGGARAPSLSNALGWLSAPPALLGLTVFALGARTMQQGAMGLAVLLAFGLTLRSAERAMSSVDGELRTGARSLGIPARDVSLRMVLPAVRMRLLRELVETALAIVAAGALYVLAWGRVRFDADDLALLAGLVLLAGAMRWRRR